MSGPRRTKKSGPTNESTMIGWIYPGQVNGMFMQSVLGLLQSDEKRGGSARIVRNGGGTVGLQSGPRIAEARNKLVGNWLDGTAAEWFLMIDSDMVFPPSALDTLFEAADPETCPIVGGLCFGGSWHGDMFPTMYRIKEPVQENVDPIEVIRDYPDNALCQVNGTGAAFLLMHRDAMRQIGDHFGRPYPWFAEGTVSAGGISFGEDWAFCIRAQSLNIPIHVHTGAKIGHAKTQILSHDVFQEHQAREADLGRPEVTLRFRSTFDDVEER